MFEKIKKELAKEHAQALKNARFYIEKGYFPTWAAEHRNDADRGLREHSTAAKWDAYKAGTLDRAKAVEIAYKRAARDLEKSYTRKLAKVERAENAALPVTVSISVEWKHSSVWGYNPAATVTIYDGNTWQQYTGSASGCGYDKLTAAVGSALNQSAAILNMLYTAKEKAYKRSKATERAEWKKHGAESNRDAIHYGAGYGILPYFEGGTGWSSFAGVFAACGYKITENRGSKYSDYFYVEKGGRK